MNGKMIKLNSCKKLGKELQLTSAKRRFCWELLRAEWKPLEIGEGEMFAKDTPTPDLCTQKPICEQSATTDDACRCWQMSFNASLASWKPFDAFTIAFYCYLLANPLIENSY